MAQDREEEDEEVHLKIKTLIVGDGAIGKTCLLSRISDQVIDWDEANQAYEPTTFNNFILKWNDLEVEVWDTAGQEAFENLRRLCYPGTDIFLVGYAVNSKNSLSNVEQKWIPEFLNAISADAENCGQAAPDPWFILVGIKADFRNTEGHEGELVALADAEAVARKMKACYWIETSAKENTNVAEFKDSVEKLALLKLSHAERPNYDEQHWLTGGAKSEAGCAKSETGCAKSETGGSLKKEKVVHKEEASAAKPTGAVPSHFDAASTCRACSGCCVQ